MSTALELGGTFYPEFTNAKNYGADLRACIESTVKKLLTTATSSDRPGMLLGKIQSGKTKTFMGVIALAFDNDFDVCVVLTKGTKALAKQTFERVDQEFGEFVNRNDLLVYDIMSLPHLSSWEQKRKLVLVVKKQSDNLERLRVALIESYPDLGRKRVLLIDDEADFASIGYSRSSAEGMQMRTIARQINDLRQVLPAVSFLQVTATPYSLYLQPEEVTISGIAFQPVRPAFTELVPVHPDYVGGDVYFPEDESQDPRPADFIHVNVDEKELRILKKKDRRALDPDDALNSNAIPAFRRAIVTFVTGAILRRLQAEDLGKRPAFYSFLIHTEAGRGAHAWQEELVFKLKDQLAAAAHADSPVIHELLDAAYDDLAESVRLGAHPLPAREAVVAAALAALREDHLLITKVNSDEEVMSMLDRSGQLRLRAPMNIFIGGQILDRGITIANLIGFFYGRNPKRFQQDTVLQHSRMYGFRPREGVAVIVRALGLTKAYRYVGALTFGMNTEHDLDHSNVTGPNLQIELPIFNQGQARIAKGEAELRRAERKLEALAIGIRSDVRALHDKLAALREAARFYENEVVPVRRAITAGMLLHYNGMLVGNYELFATRAEQIEAEHKSIEALRDYWMTRAELERAVGGNLRARKNNSARK